MLICRVERYRLRLPLRTPFETSYGRLTEKAFDLLLITDELGNQGIGELVAFEEADYIEETIYSARSIIERQLIPLLVNQKIDHPQEVFDLFKVVKGNQMAKSSLETAIWDLYAKRNQRSLQSYFIDTCAVVSVGVSLGIQPDIAKLMHQISAFVSQGYQRIKLKIQPGYDRQPVKAIREQYPNIALMVDANSAYTLKDLPLLKELDNYQLAMIEQPFAANDFLDHAKLQSEIKTSICLDENIRSVKDCQLALHLNSCQSINLKIPRVGGITEALAIISFCKANDIKVWLGGMFESGIGRALNLQFASQQVFSFPGDISASDRYFYEDIIEEPITVTDGKIRVPAGIGIGVSLAKDRVTSYGIFETLVDKKNV